MPNRDILNRPGARRSFVSLLVLRAAILSCLTLFVSNLVDFGTDSTLVMASTTVGVFVCGLMLLRNYSIRWAAVAHLAFYLCCWAGLGLADSLLSGSSKPQSRDFLIATLGSHLEVLLAAYLVGFLSSWLYWCKRQTVTVEALIASAFFVWVLSGHRNFQMDAPKKLSTIAWDLNTEPHYLLLLLSAVFSVLLGSYLALSHGRPLFLDNSPLQSAGHTRRRASFVVVTGLLLLITSAAAWISWIWTHGEAENRRMGGVSQENAQGKSPLGFHSAVGKTKQPAALVRLEGDFNPNPWSPMLYLREGALSEYAGNELVVASREFDTDVPRLLPGQVYSVEDRSNNSQRKEISQSIYLLAKAKLLFAIDYPVSVRLIKNPDPTKFEMAYQAVSVAPTLNPESLIGEEVGDPDWSSEQTAHYLRAPGSHSLQDTSSAPAAVAPADQESSSPILDKYNEDLRYLAMARRFQTEGHTPVATAISIAKFLSDNSIYTRAPGHKQTPGGDPVAPYLFSKEKRGYCVHFAHAAVYMMRLLGIPSRIATGYLTDLRYAKDGHILLHIGDRHAWPEIYVRGIGWTVVDVTPAQAENEQVLVPDEKLLEELMDKIDPTEELLTPPELTEESPSRVPAILSEIASKKALLWAIGAALLLYLTFKLILRFGYAVLPLSPPQRLRWAYLSLVSGLADIGIARLSGETRSEFAARVRNLYGVQAGEITESFLKLLYGQGPSLSTQRRLHELYSSAFKNYTTTAFKWRWRMGVLSPLSLLRLFRW